MNRDSYNTFMEKQKEIAKISLINYTYKIWARVNELEFDIYRVRHTFTIAYNDTTLIRTLMRANLYALYWRLECKDVMWIIIEHLFNVVKYDYSLYTCVN